MRKILFFGLTVALLGVMGCKKGETSAAAEDSTKMVIDQSAANESIETPVSGEYKIEHNLFIPEGIPMVVDFYADWCGPCKQYAPIFHEIAEKYAGQAIFLSVDSDKEEEIAKAYGITSIPTTVFILPGGGLLGQETGVMDAEKLESFVNQLLLTNDGDDLSI